MIRYFRVDPQTYEQTRLELDALLNLPEGETLYEPLATSPKDEQGRALIAVRADHCAMSPYAERLAAWFAANVVEEISAQQYINQQHNGLHSEF